MSWGNFCFIPGLKKWDENARNYMLGWLPTVGMAIGICWGLAYFLLLTFGIPAIASGAVLAWIPFLASGFMHADGFMDCSDALLSRGDLEKKRMILKDSHIGGFAVICLIFLILIDFGFICTAFVQGIDFINLIIIALVSRSVSALSVLCGKPMDTSQYAEAAPAVSDETDLPDDTPASKKSSILLLVAQLVIYLIICTFLLTYYLGSLFVLVGTAIGTLIPILIAKKQLGGISGDIAGYGICWGELFGIICLIFC